MSADLALQKAIRSRLSGSADVVALVPAVNILDRNSRPAPDPSIVLGEGQSVEGDDIARNVQRIYMDLHIWKKENGLVGVKSIAGAIRTALHAGKLLHDQGYYFADCRVTSMRFLRDPDGETAHGVVNVEALVRQVF